MRINKINNFYYYVSPGNEENPFLYYLKTKAKYPFKSYDDLPPFIQATTTPKKISDAIKDKPNTRLNDAEWQRLRDQHKHLFAEQVGNSYKIGQTPKEEYVNRFTKAVVSKVVDITGLTKLLSSYVVNAEVLIRILREILREQYKQSYDETVTKTYRQCKWVVKTNQDTNRKTLERIAKTLIENDVDGNIIFSDKAIISIFENDIKRLNIKYASQIFEEKYQIQNIKELEELYDKELVDFKGNRKNLVLMTVQAIGTKLGVHSYKQIINGVSGNGKSTQTNVFSDMVEVRRFGKITESSLRNTESKDFNRKIFLSNDQTIGGKDNIDTYVGAFIGGLVTDHHDKYDKMSDGGKFKITNDINVASIAIVEQGVELSPDFADKGQIERRNEYIDISPGGDFTKQRKNSFLGRNSNEFKALHKAWIEYNFYYDPVIKDYCFNGTNEYKSYLHHITYVDFIEKDALDSVLAIKEFEHMIGIIIACARIFKHKLSKEEVEEISIYFARNKQTSLERVLWKFIKERISYRHDVLDLPDNINEYDPDDIGENKQDLIVGYKTLAKNSVFFTPKTLISYKLNRGNLAKEYEVLRLNESEISHLCSRLSQKGKLGKVDIPINNRMVNHYYILEP